MRRAPILWGLSPICRPRQYGCEGTQLFTALKTVTARNFRGLQ